MNSPAKRPTAPMPLKLAYTAFMAVLISVYLHDYGPTNFLYFCDVTLLLTLVAIWTDNALLVSMCAVGIILPQAFWTADFLVNLAGVSLTGFTDYMFDSSRSLLLRGLSLYHCWQPVLLLYLVWLLGYDSRALKAWTLVAWVLVLVCFFFMPGPTPNAGLTPVNINYVWGMHDDAAQTMMPTFAWLAMLLFALPALGFVPMHLLLKRFAPQAHKNP